MAQIFLYFASCFVLVSPAVIELDSGWRLESSEKLADGISGARLSRGDYDASSWLELQHFPSTVYNSNWILAVQLIKFVLKT